MQLVSIDSFLKNVTKANRDEKLASKRELIVKIKQIQSSFYE